MIRRLALTRDLVDALRDWNKAQHAAHEAYAAGPTKWCSVPDCLNPAVRLCHGHRRGWILEEPT